MLKPDASPFLCKLQELYRISPLTQSGPPTGTALFLLDLEEWRLRFSAQTPLIWVSEVKETADDLAGRLTDLARSRGWRDRDCLVVLDGPGPELKERLEPQDYPRLVVLDSEDQERILTSPAFTNALQDLMALRLPLSHLAPYQISGTVHGSGFFGRQHEITRILGHEKASFAILGIRRIGKTWLLREIRNRLLARGEDTSRLLFLDCSTFETAEAFIFSVVHKLDIREFVRLEKHGLQSLDLPHFLELMSKRYKGQITLFLDEFDKIVDFTRRDAGLMKTIRALGNSGYCRFIVAGFQELMDEICNSKSPLYFGFEMLRLQAFGTKDTRDMVLAPMQSLRVRIENPESVVSRIHADTRGLPLFIQYCCLELISKMELRGDRNLRVADLDEIYRSEGFKTMIVNSFRDNVSQHDQLLTYALLVAFEEDKKAYSREEMTQALRQNECAFLVMEIDQACDRLVLGGVFRREGSAFQFSIPIFPRVMRTHFNLSYLLSETRREVGL